MEETRDIGVTNDQLSNSEARQAVQGAPMSPSGIVVEGVDISGEHRPRDSVKPETFQNKLTLFISCLGCVVGTGNIWRFPRIVAINSGDEGGLVFLLVWVLFLFLWSIPMLTLEYTLGRKTEKAVLGSFGQLGSDMTLWCGGWVILVSFFISCYYAVVLGWCIYYSFYFMVHELPDNQPDSSQIFKDFAENSRWPILTTGVALACTGVSVLKGVKAIERVSMVLVPLLLLIVFFTFVFSLTRSYAGVGLTYLFTPDWSAFGEPRVWIDALSQNAFDTGAGSGLLVSYSTFMAHYGVVRYSHVIPVVNNLVSLVSGMTIFGVVFSTMILTRGTLTKSQILEVLEDSGPGNTGLTFIWIPVLFENVGVLGRVVTVLFFLCLTFAGLTSLIANMELFVHTIVDWGAKRIIAVPLVVLATFSIGMLSANDLKILTNQDFVWGFGLVVNGIMFALLIIFYGVARYIDEVNQYHPRDDVAALTYSDWKLYKAWGYFIKFLAIPLGLVLFIWWGVGMIRTDDTDDDKWYELGVDTFMVTLVEWLVVLVILWTANTVYYMVRHRRPSDADGESRTLLDPAAGSRSPKRQPGKAELRHFDRLHQTRPKTVA